MQSRTLALTAFAPALVLVLAGSTAPLLAQSNPHNVPRGESAFVAQAPAADETDAQAQTTAPQADNSSVYFPEQITSQSVARARARAAEQEQLKQAGAAGGPVTQLSRGGEGAPATQQLSDGDSARALAQLSAAERQVLLEAVEGTDICERAPDIPALQALCDGRIETRSAEFAQRSNEGSAEDNLLGGRFDSERIATLEAAISRLARNSGRVEDFSDQAIASVALGQQDAVSDAQAAAGEGDPTDDLSPETQAIVNAIVQQFGGG